MNTENTNAEDSQDDDDGAYMPYDILEEDEEEGEGILIAVSRGAGVVVREVSKRVSQLVEDRPKIMPTKRADSDSDLGAMLDALGRLVAAHEEIGYHQLDKNPEFQQLIADLSRHRWKPRFASSRRRDLRHKRRRVKQQAKG